MILDRKEQSQWHGDQHKMEVEAGADSPAGAGAIETQDPARVGAQDEARVAVEAAAVIAEEIECGHMGERDRERWILSHLPLVRRVALRFYRREGAAEWDDLVSEGTVGLIKAVDGYRPERGEFLRYAMRCIAGAIRHYLRDRLHIIREPAWLQERNGAGASQVHVAPLSELMEEYCPEAATNETGRAIDGIAVGQVLRLLPVGQRAAIILRICGYRDDQIGRAAGISANGATRRRLTGMRRAREIVEREKRRLRL